MSGQIPEEHAGGGKKPKNLRVDVDDQISFPILKFFGCIRQRDVWKKDESKSD